MARPAAETTITEPCTVFYDGSCPLCRAEIGIYKRIGSRAAFHDLSTGNALPPGVTHDQAMARFHVQAADGRIESGARAFAILWQASPGGWRVLGRFVARRPIVWLAEGLYRLFLRLRPLLQRIVSARESKHQ